MKNIHFMCLLLLPFMIGACQSPSDEQIDRVRQNFQAVKLGMTKKQVIDLVGQPYRQQEYSITVKSTGPKDPDILCQAPCTVEIWLLPDTQYQWPHIAFDLAEERVIKAWEEEPEKYFW